MQAANIQQTLGSEDVTLKLRLHLYSITTIVPIFAFANSASEYLLDHSWRAVLEVPGLQRAYSPQVLLKPRGRLQPLGYRAGCETVAQR